MSIPLPDHSVEDLIDIIDENGDGMITFSEFKHAVEDHKLHERYHRVSNGCTLEMYSKVILMLFVRERYHTVSIGS